MADVIGQTVLQSAHADARVGGQRLHHLRRRLGMEAEEQGHEQQHELKLFHNL